MARASPGTARSRRVPAGNDCELLGLAIPALGALVAEPIFLIADSAIVGHLGTAQLAGLSIASAVLLNAVFLCIFLAHGTTAAVARRAGAGDLRRAYTLGLDGIWLAVSMGLGLAAVGLALAPVLVDLLGASDGATPYAVTYLRISLLGLPAMLVVLAATGALRGLKDTRTPLLATGLAAVANVPLNLVLVYALGLGVAGSALGTVMAQLGAAAWLCTVVVRGARGYAAPLRPDRPGIRAAASANAPLFARTVLLRISLLTMTFVAAAQGDVALASHQIAFTLWYLLAMPPESFAIASQALVGHALGAGEPATAKAVSRRALAWGARERARVGSPAGGPAPGVHPDLHHRPCGPRPRLVARARGRREPADRRAALCPRRDPHRRRRHALPGVDHAGRSPDVPAARRRRARHRGRDRRAVVGADRLAAGPAGRGGPALPQRRVGPVGAGALDAPPGGLSAPVRDGPGPMCREIVGVSRRTPTPRPWSRSRWLHRPAPR